jgi:tRNA(fMet)-specific endonuclease VapC
LDTNVLSEPLKTTPDESVLRNLKKHQYEISTAAPVWHELQYGCLRLPNSRKRRVIEQYLNNVIRQTILILPYDERTAEWHAKERARLSLKGEVPSFVDGQIASIAKVNGLILVTRNVGDFKAFSGLKIKNWHRT